MSYEHYYINKNAQNGGENEVHSEDCSWLKKIVNKEYLGFFSSCKQAVSEAKKKYPKADGCYYCSSECHTR